MRRPVWAGILCKHSVSEIHPGDAIWCKSQDASLYGAICEVHPVPNNLNQVKKMYEFLKDLLREKQLLSYWWDFAKNTEKDSLRGGSLSKVWLKLENTKNSDSPPLSLDEIVSLVEQTICLRGQTTNSISHHRQYNILSNVWFPQEVKNMLQNKVELLQTNDRNLFGK